ncbi:MAG: glutathione peroxidase [Bacteroidota bacterium]|nr:glutathione peroxidase [Bacteroidota bacterium]
MKKSFLNISGIFLITAIVAIFWAGTTTKTNKTMIKGSVYDFKLKTIDGEEISLSKFKGKKLLLVNVASECGYTPQYKNLEALHKQYGDKLVLIGFPANNFGKQEPGTNTEIKSFCTKNYGVTFLMMDKISVAGNDAHPLYKWLSNKEDNGVCENAPNWNFCKYLIDEKGAIIKFFPSKVDPLSTDITALL